MQMNRLLALVLLLAAAPHATAQRMPVTTASDAARVHYVRGLHAMSHADAVGGRDHMDAALAADPGFAMAHLYRAAASPAGRDEHLRQATALGARASDAERQYIASYAAGLGGDRDREVALLTALAGRYPGDPFPMFVAANTEMNRGRSAEAVAASRRALVADPAFAGAYNTIGYAEVARGDLAAAEAAFREYVRLAPDEANPYDSFGEFYLNQGRLDEAEAQYRIALTKDSRFDNARTMLARIGIERASLRFEQAVAAKDADAIAALYTAGAQAFPPGSAPLAGRAAIRTYFAAMLASGVDGVELTTTQVRAADDMAVETGTLVVRAGGAVVDRGQYIVVWARVDGAWLLSRDIWNSSVPVTTAAR